MKTSVRFGIMAVLFISCAVSSIVMSQSIRPDMAELQNVENTILTPTPNPNEYIVDNKGPGFFVSGAWQAGTVAPDKYGSDYRYCKVESAGVAVAQWFPYDSGFIVPGYYEIYVWYPAGTNRSENATYTVRYDGTYEPFSINQRENGGKWNKLCKPGTSYFHFNNQNIDIQLTNRTVDRVDPADARYVIADAVKFVYLGQDPPYPPTPTPTPTQEPNAYIIDNGDDGFFVSGSWDTGTAAPDKFGGDYRYCRVENEGHAVAQWYPHRAGFTVPGYYEVYIWYPQGTNRSAHAAYSVCNKGSCSSFAINQQNNGGRWNKLGGLFYFDSTDVDITLTNSGSDSTKYVIADAVKLMYLGTLPPITPAPPTSTPTFTPTITPSPIPRIYSRTSGNTLTQGDKLTIAMVSNEKIETAFDAYCMVKRPVGSVIALCGVNQFCNEAVPIAKSVPRVGAGVTKTVLDTTISNVPRGMYEIVTVIMPANEFPDSANALCCDIKTIEVR